jgi:nitroreductase
MKPEKCPPVRKEWLPSAEEAEHFLRSRRSIRRYRDRSVDRETLSRLIDIARFAPSGHNIQPVRWLVFQKREEVRALAGLVVDWMRQMLKEGSPLAAALSFDRIVLQWDKGIDRVCRDAPHIIVTHAPKTERVAPQACTLALSYLELAAPSMGLGACWAGFFNAAANFWPPMQESLGLPPGHISFGAMMIGYPRYGYHRLPLRKEARILWR